MKSFKIKASSTSPRLWEIKLSNRLSDKLSVLVGSLYKARRIKGFYVGVFFSVKPKHFALQFQLILTTETKLERKQD